MTHTYAALEVTQSTFDEIAAKLKAAGYDHAFDDEEGAIDMHGIGLVVEKKPFAPTALPEEKKPRLFYWEEAEDAWCPAEELTVDNIISVDLFLADGDTHDVTFKRQDMTDAEFAAIPEA
jgi:hypothetical protein